MNAYETMVAGLLANENAAQLTALGLDPALDTDLDQVLDLSSDEDTILDLDIDIWADVDVCDQWLNNSRVSH